MGFLKNNRVEFMGINENIKKLWETNFFCNYRSSKEVTLELKSKFGTTCSNITAHLNSCGHFLRNTKDGWVQKGHFSNEKKKSKKGQNYFSMLNIHPEIKKVSEKLFEDGYYSQATFDAFKRITNLVKEKSKCSSLDGKSLMLTVFSSNKPILKFNDLISATDKDEQEGFMYLFAGAISGIRNPKAHRDVFDNGGELRALEYIMFASLLCKKLDEAKTE